MKKTSPGSADSGKVPAKIFTAAVGPFHSRRRDRMGPTATIIENRHDSGWELRKLPYPLAICVKKSAKRTVYTVVIFELFAIKLLAHILLHHILVQYRIWRTMPCCYPILGRTSKCL
jgi:hypothetical protein